MDAFVQELANFALEYAIPRQKIAEAKDVFDKTGSPYLLNALQREAQKFIYGIKLRRRRRTFVVLVCRACA